MDLFQALILGIIQGITEFLPISSSGHLVLLEKFWNINNGTIFFNVMLHFASLLAVVLFYRKKIWLLIRYPLNKTNFFLILATIPTIIIVVLFNDFFENAFSGTLLVLGFLISACLLLVTEKMARTFETKKEMPCTISASKALLLGVFQGLAVVPGLSRSGTTVCAGIMMGINKREAIDFSFLMSIPIIIASMVYELIKSDFSTLLVDIEPLNIILSFIITFVFAILGIKIMLKVVEKVQYYWFAIYLVALSIITLFLN